MEQPGPASAGPPPEDELRRRILDSIPFSVLAMDPDGRIVAANPAAVGLLGHHAAALVGRDIATLDAEPRGELTVCDEREHTYLRADGTAVAVTEAIAPMLGDDGEVTGFLAVAYDVTQRNQAQADVAFLANHDALTGMPNRSMLDEHVTRAIEDAAASGVGFALLLLDLDHFKRVNDSLGHHAGDELLLHMAERLRRWSNPSDVIARLGGDEFGIVVDDVRDPADLAPRVDALLTVLDAPVRINGNQLALTASIGGAVYPEHGTDPSTLLRHADAAMYQAKASGRNHLQWFRSTMLDETNTRIAMASDLRQALDSGGLSVAYQPQVDLRTGRVVSFEALARWRHPSGAAVPASEFIAVAEETGMIVRLGGWVLRRACRDIASIQRVLGRPLRLAVNVSPRQFRTAGFLGEVAGALNDSGLDPGQLDLEITEGVLMDDRGEVLDMLRALRATGVKIAVDDFGRGYSSLAYLARFPVDELKIDRSFVHDISPAVKAPIVDAVIVMSHALGLSVVAEGVENPHQEHYLRERGCDLGQGFLYGPAVPIDRAVRSVQAIGVF